MDLPNVSHNHGRNVYCNRNHLKVIRIEWAKKFQNGHANKAHAIANQSHLPPTSTFKSKSAQNRISTTIALLLYILYTLSIHLLWTNCVIFTESAQQQLKLNVNPTWNLLHQHYQRTESNRNLNSNSSHNNLKSNFANVSSHSNSPKLNGIANESNNSDSNSTVSRNSSIAISIHNNGSANQFDFLTNLLASSVNREVALRATSVPPLQRIDVNHRTTASEAVSPFPMRTEIGMRMTMRDKHIHVINRLKRERTVTKPLSMLRRNRDTAYQNPIIRKNFNRNKRNEFRKRISDEIRFKRYQFESENVIKSAKNHAIKRNVNIFTFANLGDNSNVSIINTTTVPFLSTTKSKTIKSSTLSSSSSPSPSVASASHEMKKLITIHPTNFDGKSISGMEKTITNLTSPPIIRNSVSTVLGENQLNQTVNNDRKLNANDSNNSNSPTINRMENIGRFGNVTTTTTMTKTMVTRNPITRNFSSGSTPVRSRVNDVFEMDTKQKYSNYSRNINNNNNNNRSTSNGRRNQDNQVTSFEGDEQNKWHVQHRNGKRIISLLGLFELSTRNGLRVEGLSELAAAELAVRHINKREHLLPGYTLQLITNDTKCDPGVGVDRFFHAVYTKRLSRVQMLLGSACSEVTESLAKVVPHWNVVQ
ncbi:protein kinase 4-like, partial [Contarinia nasturtii]|uniref:protein kinase 4-like n=1 Tax=Contarinia nasturtii TaxID=265458 RepID=UPI0012D3DB81